MDLLLERNEIVGVYLNVIKLILTAFIHGLLSKSNELDFHMLVASVW